MPERSGGVHINESVTNGIYFMCNCFFEKMSQAQNERKVVYVKKMVLIAIFILFSFFIFFFLL